MRNRSWQEPQPAVPAVEDGGMGLKLYGDRISSGRRIWRYAPPSSHRLAVAPMLYRMQIWVVAPPCPTILRSGVEAYETLQHLEDGHGATAGGFAQAFHGGVGSGGSTMALLRSSQGQGWSFTIIFRGHADSSSYMLGGYQEPARNGCQGGPNLEAKPRVDGVEAGDCLKVCRDMRPTPQDSLRHERELTANRHLAEMKVPKHLRSHLDLFQAAQEAEVSLLRVQGLATSQSSGPYSKSDRCVVFQGCNQGPERLCEE